MKHKNLCIIPAKGRSNRFPRKNMALLDGKPLIYYAIESAIKSEIYDEIIVSTEDDEIRDAAEKFGASVPFARPEELVKDSAGVVEVCLNVIEELGKQGKTFDYLHILLPTSPLRTVEDILGADEVFHRTKPKCLMSVTEYPHTPFSALSMDEHGLLNPMFKDYVDKQSQLHPKAYRCNGAVTIVDIQHFVKEKAYYIYPLAAYPMPWERSIDVDHEFDLKLAEFIRAKIGAK